MASTSTIVNRALRTYVTPALREAGFTKTDARNGWCWQTKTVWVFNVRAVGNYFSSVTGWQPGSVCVWLGVLYAFVPSDSRLKVDDEGQPVPAEHICHVRSHLEFGLDQDFRTSGIPSAVERRRKDIWWVEPDGANATSVAADIGKALREHALPWFWSKSDLAATLSEIEEGHDCLVKFDLAAFLARELGDELRWRTYAERAEAESVRIGHSVNRRARYGI